MDIKEAIIHAQQVADGCGVDSRDCAYQHNQLVDWLEELVRVRAVLDRLGLTLEELERAKAVVVLPCEVGDTLYEPYQDGLIDEATVNEIEISICTNMGVYGLSDIGKTVFLTRAEAEAALSRGERDDMD